MGEERVALFCPKVALFWREGYYRLTEDCDIITMYRNTLRAEMTGVVNAEKNSILNKKDLVFFGGVWYNIV